MIKTLLQTALFTLWCAALSSVVAFSAIDSESKLLPIGTIQPELRHNGFNENGSALFVLSNHGSGTMQYSGTSPGRPQYQMENLTEFGTWERGAWTFCGTGVKTQSLLPDESVTLVVHPEQGVWRLTIGVSSTSKFMPEKLRVISNPIQPLSTPDAQ